MQPLAEQIARVSLPVVLISLTLLTGARAALHVARAPFCRHLRETLESILLALGLVYFVLRPFLVQSYYIPSGSMRPTLRENDHILVNKWVYRNRLPERGEVIVFRAPVQVSRDEREFIKRVIGIPGDTIEAREGYVMIGAAKYTRNDIRHTLGEAVTRQVSEAGSGTTSLRLTSDHLQYGNQTITGDQFAERAGRPGQPVQITPGVILRNGVPLTECDITDEDPQYRVAPMTVPPGQYFVLGDNRNRSDDSHRWGTLPADRIVGRAEWVFWPLSRMRRVEVSH